MGGGFVEDEHIGPIAEAVQHPHQRQPSLLPGAQRRGRRQRIRGQPGRGQCPFGLPAIESEEFELGADGGGEHARRLRHIGGSDGGDGRVGIGGQAADEGREHGRLPGSRPTADRGHPRARSDPISPGDRGAVAVDDMLTPLLRRPSGPGLGLRPCRGFCLAQQRLRSAACFAAVLAGVESRSQFAQRGEAFGGDEEDEQP